MLKIYSSSACLLSLAILNFSMLVSPVLAATYNVSSTSQLIGAIQFANLTPQADTINLRFGTYTFNTATPDSDEFGELTSLPRINTPITLNGNGATIRRNPTAAEFRILRVLPQGHLTLNDVIISGGYGPSGAGIYNEGTLRVNRSTIRENVTKRRMGLGSLGAGIFSWGPLTINRCLILDNAVEGDIDLSHGGGGICSMSAFQMDETTVEGNRASGGNALMDGNSAVGGGGVLAVIFFEEEGDIEITNCTFERNAAVASDSETFALGGGLHIGITEAPSSALISNCTFTSNQCASTIWAVGGALSHNALAGTTTISYCTIAENTCDGGWMGEGAGGLSIYGSSFSNLNIRGTVLRDNAPRNLDADPYSSGGGSPPIIGENIILAESHNLSSDDSALGIFTHPTDMNSTPAMLGAFGDYGGFTKTFSLLPGSPAIDAGDPTSTLNRDQRGWPRPMDGDGNGVSIVDIGAFELYRRANDVETWLFYE